MRVFAWILLAVFSLGIAAGSEELLTRARQLESSGDSKGARDALQNAARSSPENADVLLAYSEFLDRYKDPAARAAYGQTLALLQKTGDKARMAQAARRLVVLDLLAGDNAAAARHVEAYRAAGGSGLSVPPPGPAADAARDPSILIQIPGPLPSFARMAALTPDLKSIDVLPALARNVVTNGYQASSSNEALDQTEYLKLVIRYLSQARELEKLAGAEKTVRIETCESAQTADLLRILGYRMRGGCGSELVLETVNATRAFLTIDSGFPLADLEQSLRTNRPFVYDFKPTELPVLFGPEYWLSAKEKQSGDFIDVFLSDPSICRLYLGFSKLDRATAEQFRKDLPAQKLRPFAHVLDFFGGMLQLQDGKAVVPGGARAASAWEDLVGTSPDKGVAFLERLIARDDGWVASYFDALARIEGPVQDYLTEPSRMKRFYAALRGKITSPGPARPVFRSNTDLMLLTTRLQLNPDGRPHIPGNIEVWKNLFIKHPHGKYDGKLTKAASGWKEPDDLIEALFALCRKAVENEPLKIFMALTDLDRRRQRPLEPTTVDRLAREYRHYGSQYPIFGEIGSLTDATIITYLDNAKVINEVKDSMLRANSAGIMQSLVSIWQILCRQESIPAAEADAVLAAILTPFKEKIRSSQELFDAGRGGVQTLLKATKSPANVSPQDRLMDLIAGADQSSDAESHGIVVQNMMRIFEAQRLISLSSLFELADHLESLSRGEKLNTAMINRLSSRIAEIQLPRAGLSSIEKNSFAFGYWTEKHIENQRKLNLRAVITKAGADPEKLKDARGNLAGFLRDTLVGFSYMKYAPPGAQILFTNPLFVRSHDFLGIQGSPQTWRSTEVFGSGWPSSAGGRLVGSLVSLPYALAEAEQNFLIPDRIQALIWADLVPQMLQSSTVGSWWNVTPGQLHWVGLHLRQGESLVAESAINAELKKDVMASLSRMAAPARAHRVETLLSEGRVTDALDNVTPSELFAVTRELLEKRPDDASPAAREITRLARQHPEQINYRVISRAFGTPKPTLATSYRPEMLNLRTFPTLMGYSSRIMAESWESSTLYYAALADEMHMRPSRLNLLMPEWTQKTVERIFATHLEDWPALLRSLRLVGEDIRQETRKEMAAEQKASLRE